MEKIKSVNLGGWFVLERWIKPSLFQSNNVIGRDETCFSKQALNKEEALYEHYKTFITKEDIIWLQEHGINQVRIPIPWWLYGDEEYVRSVHHIDKALDMINELEMNFMLDLHTAPGCQNGFDNGGIEGVIEWHKNDKHIENTIEVLEKIVARYKMYPHFHSIQLLNEPHFNTDLEIIKDFYVRAYNRLRKITPDKYIVMHDAFRLRAWEDFFKKHNFKHVILDTHMYQVFDKNQHDANLETHLKQALSRNEVLREIEKFVPVVVGEWSLALRTNKYINKENMDDCMKEYATAQIIGMREATGHIFWTYKVEDGMSGWNFKSLVERKIINLEEYLK